jgi:ribulose-phosphate 3-epimerase
MLNLEKDVKRLEEAGADAFHIDVMDGGFAPNFGIGIDTIKAIKSISSTPLHVHLMVNAPYTHVKRFVEAGADTLVCHVEAATCALDAIERTREFEKRVSIAIHPDTTVKRIRGLLSKVDEVLIMTVNPGYAGQKFMEDQRQKIEELIALTKHEDFTICLDGGVTIPIAKEYYAKGVSSFVMGNTLFYNNPPTLQEVRREITNARV